MCQEPKAHSGLCLWLPFQPFLQGDTAMSGGVPILLLENHGIALFAIKAWRFIPCGQRPDVTHTQRRNPRFQLAQQSSTQPLSAIGFLYKEVRQIKPSVVVVSVLIGQAT